MKRIFYFLFSLSLFTLFLLPVNAEKYVNNVFRISLSGEQNINYDEQISINVDVKVSYNLSGISADIIYDNTKLEYIGCESEKFACTFNENRFLLDSVEGIEGEESVATLTFKILPGFNFGDTTFISLKSVEGSDNTVGNKFDFKLHRLGNDTSLTSLSVENELLIPEFSPNVLNYKVTTFNNFVIINATSNSNFSNIGKTNIAYGNNFFEIVVKAENGEEKVYFINVYREKELMDNDNNKKDSVEKETNNTNKKTPSANSKNNNSVSSAKSLSSNKKFVFLKINDTKFDLKDDIFEYDLTVDSKELFVDYELEDKKSKVIISGDTKFIKDGSLVIISVVAEDGSQIDYKFHITKEDNNSVVSVTGVDDEKKDSDDVKEKGNKYYIPIVVFVFVILALLFFIKSRKSNDSE